jgi:hypothetical protein
VINKPTLDKMIKTPDISKHVNNAPRKEDTVTPLRPSERGASFIQVNK